MKNLQIMLSEGFNCYSAEIVVGKKLIKGGLAYYIFWYLCRKDQPNMKRFFLTSLLILLGVVAPAASAQESAQPKGKAIINIFANFHTGFGHLSDTRGFAMDRSYFGYQYSFDNGLEFRAVMDVGKSSDVGDLQRVAYIKNAMVRWRSGRLTLSGGLISTTSFKVQEDFWGYRYMKMVLQDYYKFASSADLGLSVQYKFSDWLSADAIVVNGEGYKKIQSYDGLQYGLGATLTPAKGLTLRLYGSVNEHVDEGHRNSAVYAAFAGYRCEAFSLGAEYNRIENMGGIEDHHIDGVSLYTTVRLGGRVNAFARYDEIFSKSDWNISKDETTLLAGVEVRPNKYIKISPNLRYDIAKGAGVSNKCMAYISCFFGF